MSSQDFSTNELEDDFPSDQIIFKKIFFVDLDPCRPGVKHFRSMISHLLDILKISKVF